MSSQTHSTDSVVIVRHGIVCGRGATLRAAVIAMLGLIEVTPADAGDLIAGDSTTRTRYSTDIIAAAIASVLADAAANLAAVDARLRREIQTERERQHRESRGVYDEAE